MSLDKLFDLADGIVDGIGRALPDDPDGEDMTVRPADLRWAPVGTAGRWHLFVADLPSAMCAAAFDPTTVGERKDRLPPRAYFSACTDCVQSLHDILSKIDRRLIDDPTGRLLK